jgi:parallel beta-helix repeat protein
VRGKPLGYFRDLTDSIIEGSSFGEVILAYCSNVTVQNGEFHDISSGIFFGYCSDCKLINNEFYNNSHDGIAISYSTRSVIVNNTVYDNTAMGIRNKDSSHTIYINNTIRDNDETGLEINNSFNCTLIDNTFVNNGVDILSSPLSSWQHNFANNTVNGRALGYNRSVTNTVIDASMYGQLILVDSTGVIIENADISTTDFGILLGFCTNVTVTRSTLHDNYRGIKLLHSDDCELFNNTFYDNACGAYFQYSDMCKLTNNTITSSTSMGAMVYYSADCILTNNTISDSGSYGIGLISLNNCTLIHNSIYDTDSYGLYLQNANNCDITNNEIHENHYTGIRLVEASSGNAIYGNLIGWNNINAQDDGSSNQWDDGISIGNAWGDYPGIGTYSIAGSANATDHYPTKGDTDIPILDHPEDVEYNEGEMGPIITWTPVESHPAAYEVKRNGTPYSSGPWDGSSIVILVYGLDYGLHNFTITVNDTCANAESDTVFVFVNDGTNPHIIHPTITQFEAFHTGESITWNASDLHPTAYEVYRNQSLIDSGEWDGSDIVVPLDNLEVGLYNFTLVVFDIDGNQAKDEVHISAIDTTPPTIDTPLDVGYQWDVTGSSITWHPEDPYPYSFEILRNQTSVSYGSWDGQPISIGVDGLSPGVYNYTLVITDSFGNWASDTVLVIVTGDAISTTTTTTTTGITLPDSTMLIVFGGVALVIVAVVIIVIRFRKQFK